MTQSPQPARLVVLVSGYGSNLQAIIDACGQAMVNSLPLIHAHVVAVISNRAEAYGLVRAEKANIPAITLLKTQFNDRIAYDIALADQITEYSPKWIVLAGWMRILSNTFLSRFQGKVINLHPALPGAFPGTHAIERAYEAYKNGLINETGVMVHMVPDDGVDSGPVLAQEIVPIHRSDNLDDLENRVHAVEHRLLVKVLYNLTGSCERAPYE